MQFLSQQTLTDGRRGSVLVRTGGRVLIVSVSQTSRDQKPLQPVVKAVPFPIFIGKGESSSSSTASQTGWNAAGCIGC